MNGQNFSTFFLDAIQRELCSPAMPTSGMVWRQLAIAKELLNYTEKLDEFPGNGDLFPEITMDKLSPDDNDQIENEEIEKVPMVSRSTLKPKRAKLLQVRQSKIGPCPNRPSHRNKDLFNFDDFALLNHLKSLKISII